MEFKDAEVGRLPQEHANRLWFSGCSKQTQRGEIGSGGYFQWSEVSNFFLAPVKVIADHKVIQSRQFDRFDCLEVKWKEEPALRQERLWRTEFGFTGCAPGF
jgi:hypothetical protein